MEDFASLTAEARSHDDNREETSPTQKYPPAYPPSSATAIPQTAAGGSVTASVLTYQPQPYTWGSGISEEGRGNLGGNPSHAAADASASACALSAASVVPRSPWPASFRPFCSQRR